MSEKPSRYPRSTNGLLAALVVTLLAVGVFVVLRSLARPALEVEREPVDYAAAAQAARSAGFEVVAPTSLPAGWIATAIDLEQTDPPLWGMGLLTDEGKFVGLRQEDGSVQDLVEVNVDDDAIEGETVQIQSRVGSTWQSWSDEGGDTGYSMEYGDQTLLVYGSAPAQELRELITLLER